MPVICDKYDLYFTHVPKAGGSFVERFLRQQMDGRRVGPRHATYRWCPPERPVTYRVFVVREPVSWYKSYWAYARAATKPSAWPIWEAGDKRHPTHRLDLTGGAPTFERFVRKVLREFPNGYVRAMYCDFLNGSTHALRTERLYDDFEWLLGAVGFENPGVIRKWPHANETPTQFSEQAVLPIELEDELREVDNLEGLLFPFVPSEPPG